MKKPSRREAFAAFRQEFSDLCADWGGIYSAEDTIFPEAGGVAFRFETALGALRASIHAPRNWQREEIIPGSIYMQFRTCSGSTSGPGRGDFNRHSHKWNIHFSGEAADARQAALQELYKRLAMLSGPLTTATV